MATNPKLDRLIDLLAESTLKKELAWETTTDENSFRVDFPTGAVRVNKSPLGQRGGLSVSGSGSVGLLQGPTTSGVQELYSLTLLDKAGEISDEYQPDNPAALSNLFSIARASALQTEELVDSLLSLLENPPKAKDPREQLSTTFAATDQYGRTHIVDVWRVVIPSATKTGPGQRPIMGRALRTRDGATVNVIEKGVYKISGTDLTLTSDASNAP